MSLPVGAQLLSSNAATTRELDHLSGRVSRHSSLHLSGEYPNLSRGRVEWLVAAPDGTEFEITIATEKAGTCRVRVITRS